jgi:transposase
MRRIQIHLSKSDLKTIEALRSKGLHSSREISRAHILAALDYQLSDEQIGAVLGVSRKVIWRTLSAYREEGLDYALRDATRSGAPRKYRPDQAQAEVAAVACSQPPPGAKRWTVKLLTEAVGQREGLAGINRESVRQLLKKTS